MTTSVVAKEENIKTNNQINQNNQTNNVIGLVVDNPYTRIMSFINGYERKNTRGTYLRHFKKMFMYTTGKQLEQLTYDDI